MTSISESSLKYLFYFYASLSMLMFMHWISICSVLFPSISDVHILGLYSNILSTHINNLSHTEQLNEIQKQLSLPCSSRKHSSTELTLINNTIYLKVKEDMNYFLELERRIVKANTNANLIENLIKLNDNLIEIFNRNISISLML